MKNMKVKLNIFERWLMKFSRLLSELSFDIRHSIYHKHDPNHVYNKWSYGKKCNEIIFSNEKE